MKTLVKHTKPSSKVLQVRCGKAKTRRTVRQLVDAGRGELTVQEDGVTVFTSKDGMAHIMQMTTVGAT